MTFKKFTGSPEVNNYRISKLPINDNRHVNKHFRLFPRRGYFFLHDVKMHVRRVVTCLRVVPEISSITIHVHVSCSSNTVGMTAFDKE